MGLDKIFPEHTEAIKKVTKLQEIDQFPVVFRLCTKPGGFQQAKLEQEGYQDAKDYFFGRSKYDDDLVGWAGHNADGSTRNGVAGRFDIYSDKIGVKD